MADLSISLSKEQKGYLYIIAGCVLLFHTLNFLREWLNVLLVGAAIALIIIGILKANVHIQLRSFIQRSKSSLK